MFISSVKGKAYAGGFALLLSAVIPAITPRIASAGTCQITSGYSQGIKYATWGCGTADVSYYSGGISAFADIDDRKTDGYCVYSKVQTGNTWKQMPDGSNWHGRSCGSPATAVKFLSPWHAPNIIRLFRGPSTNGNYLTLWWGPAY